MGRTGSSTADGTDGWNYYRLYLSQAAADAGITLGANFQVRFRQSTEAGNPDQWRRYDDVFLHNVQADDWYRFDVQTGEASAWPSSIRIQALPETCFWNCMTWRHQDRHRQCRRDQHFQAIRDFVAAYSGTYYARVSAGDVPVRQATTTSSSHAVQPSSARPMTARRKPGHQPVRPRAGSTAQTVHVAVLDGWGYAQQAVNQLNDDTWGDFDAHVVNLIRSTPWKNSTSSTWW